MALILFVAEAVEAQGSWVGRTCCGEAGLLKLGVAGILWSFVGRCVVFVDFGFTFDPMQMGCLKGRKFTTRRRVSIQPGGTLSNGRWETAERCFGTMRWAVGGTRGTGQSHPLTPFPD